MSHAREQIRTSIASILGNLATTQDRVFAGSPWPLDATQMPGLIVLVPTERVDEDFTTVQDGVSRLGRRLTIIIVGYDKGDDIETKLDQIALEVEQAMAADSTLGGVVIDSEIVTSEIDVDIGESRVGQIRLTYEAVYRTTRAAPQTILS